MNMLNDKSKQPPEFCGRVGLLGRPNVGKSTLLNHLLAEKLSITSRKPQTTRHQILGIKTTQDTQVIYVDTPGLHSGSKKALNHYMNRAADSTLQGVDLVLLLIEANRWTDEEDWILEKLKHTDAKVFLVINKTDRVKQKIKLLPFIDKIQGLFPFEAIVPISALKQDNLEQLEKLIQANIPQGPFVYEADQITDRSMRFLASERIREKLMRQLGDELPYDLTVCIEAYREEAHCDFIHAAILVERSSQKPILVGKGGQRLRLVGQEARIELEALLGKKVMLELWVKVKEGWSDDERALKSLGYDD